jgi:fructuronate reductase
VPEITERRSGYSPASVGIGIVHIGLGAFHRAHQATYVENWLDRNGGGNWGICAANIRSNAGLVDRMTAQGCRFHVAAYADREHVLISEINSIRRAIYAGADKEALLEHLVAPTTRIVTLTVTEKAYCLSSATGDLLTEMPDIAHDIVHPGRPRTVPGLLVEALRRRRASGLAPFTVLSCDNMPDNGARTKRALSMLAAHNTGELAAWIDSEVACPSSMVDRIVPAATAESTGKLEALLGFSDPAAIACESFSQWVIEDRFVSGRPDWEPDGVEMVASVKPFETMKLRLLNGAHSLLAYIGLSRGKTTVAEAIGDPGLQSLVGRFFREAAATLDAAVRRDIDQYTSALLVRFRNDALDHRLSQIAMDGSQKIPQRWLEAALINLEHGRTIDATATALAAWMVYVRGSNDRGRKWQVDDPLASKLAQCHDRANADETVDSLLAMQEVFSERLRRRDDFRNAVRRAYQEALR